MNIRNKLFWLADKLRGDIIKKHLEEIRFINDNPNNNDTINRRKQALSNLIAHTVNTVPYYKNLTSSAKIHDFPVVDKNTIRENIDLFISDKYSKEKLKRGQTSGSTGTPFVFYWDKNKIRRNNADTLYFWDNNGYKFGKLMYYFRVWNAANKQSKLSLGLKNLIAAEASLLSHEYALQLKKELTEVRNEKYFLSYASTLELLLSYYKGEDLSVANVKCIYSSSEVLTDRVRAEVSQLFSCPVYSRYSNLENGMIAQQYDMTTSEFKINNASYYVEILNFDNNQHVGDGEKGRIVITDLYNYGMPLLRYDTGDVGIYTANSSLLQTAAIKSIEGRAKDFIYSTNGKKLTPIIVNNTMELFASIKQYQFIQKTENKYEIRLNAGISDELENQICIALKSYLGQDAEFNFSYVTEIPVLNSGKRQYVKQECPKYI